MINVKQQVFDAIKNICGNVSDSYPKDWGTLPAVQYMEEANNVELWTDDKEQMAFLQYRFDIWSNRSTSETAMALDAAVSPLGLRRVFCQDVDDPSGLKHKVMRYEGVIDIETEMIYQRNL